LIELYRWLRKSWIYHILEQKKKTRQPRKPVVMRPKSEQDCPFCVKEKGRHKLTKPEMPMAWSQLLMYTSELP
jgi:hypothetical protein